MDGSAVSSSHTSRDEPTIAIVICTRDRTAALAETLDSVWVQTRLPDELIVLDDGVLPAEVQARLAGRCRELGIAWRYERSSQPGLTRSRNRAADLAASDVLQYLDDDVSCDRDFLAEVVRLMRDPAVAGVTATVREPAFGTVSARLYQFGYRLAAWWRVGPRARPPGPTPSVLGRPDEATPARWLSGAAMALRREVVRAHRFDETLTRYALGEDHEMGYRLAPRYWLVRAERAIVTHRRDAAHRPDSRRLGFMTSYNYLHILRGTCRLGAGDWLLIGWGLGVVAAMHVVWAVAGSRRAHLAELRGMLDGVAATLGDGSAVPRRREDVRRTTRPVSRRPTRVLFVTNRLEPGGAERMLLSLVRHLPRWGVRSFVGCLKQGGPLAAQCRADGTPVFDQLLRFRADGVVLLRLRRILATHRIDVIVAAHSGGDRMFWSTLAGRLCGVPVVVWSHWCPGPGEHHFERANRALYRCVEAFVAVGQNHRAALIRHEHVPAGRIAVVPNCVELDRFSRDAVSRAAARAHLGLVDHHVAIAVIANLRREKRHDLFIEAARRLAAGNENLRFFIIGDGPDGDAVRAAAASSGLEPEVLRLLGARDDVAALLPGLDMCCLCSEQECFSVTMLEAAAAGCAFIGPDSGSMTEFLEHGRTGLVIRPADLDSLADAVAALIADAALRRRLGVAARDRVARDHGIDKMAGGLADVFRAAAAPGSRRGRGTAAGDIAVVRRESW